MEEFFIKPPAEKKNDTKSQLSLEEKIEKLILLCTTYKDKYDELKLDYQKTLTANIELEDEKKHLLNEKQFLEKRIIQLDDELMAKIQEIENLNASNLELDSITKSAASRIEKLLADSEFEV